MRSSLLILASVALIVAGCAHGEQPSWGEGAKSVIITVTTQGEISTSMEYFIALDTDGNLLTGPGDDPTQWNTFYRLRWANGNFYFRKPGESEQFFTNSSVAGNTITVEVDMDDLGDPSLLDIMVVTTDRGGNLVDALANYFTVRLGSQSYVSRSDASSEVSNPQGDIVRVEVEVKR